MWPCTITVVMTSTIIMEVKYNVLHSIDNLGMIHVPTMHQYFLELLFLGMVGKV